MSKRKRPRGTCQVKGREGKGESSEIDTRERIVTEKNHTKEEEHREIWKAC